MPEAASREMTIHTSESSFINIFIPNVGSYMWLVKEGRLPFWAFCLVKPCAGGKHLKLRS
jgi:hypothetical protein